MLQAFEKAIPHMKKTADCVKVFEFFTDTKSTLEEIPQTCYSSFTASKFSKNLKNSKTSKDSSVTSCHIIFIPMANWKKALGPVFSQRLRIGANSPIAQVMLRGSISLYLRPQLTK